MTTAASAAAVSIITTTPTSSPLVPAYRVDILVNALQHIALPGNHHGELLVHGAQLRNRLGYRVHCLRPLLQIFAWYELLRLHLLRRQRHVDDDLVDESATNT